MGPCKHCGEPIVLDVDVGLVCTGCAELVDPARVVLAADSEILPPNPWLSVAQKTVKTARGRYLAGQDKDARTSRNLEEMRGFLQNLARAALVPSMADRAFHFFQQAMATGEYRWGRTAKLVAGASLAISLRLNGRPELFRDISLLLGEKVHSLNRSFTSVISALKLDQLPPSEPKSHIQNLQEYLSSALNSTESSVPAQLVSTLKSLSTAAIVTTATALSELLVSSIPPSAVARLPTPPTACAVFMWAIEAELRTSLAHLGQLAAFLGSRYNATQSVVMNRYKTIQDELIERIDKIDWLDHYEPNSGKCGRAKIPRRVVVARGVKAVIETERDYRREQFRPDSAGDSDCQDAGNGQHPRKRRRVHALRDATRFVLNPLVGPLPASLFPLSFGHSPPMPLPTFILTPSFSFRRDAMPTRLQLLAASRGGVGPDEIHDDELFEEDELAKLFRTKEEAEELNKVLGLQSADQDEKSPVARPPPRRRRKDGGGTGRSSRINAEFLALFMEDEKSDDGYGDLLAFDDAEVIVEDDGDVTGALMGLNKSLLDEEKEDDFPLFEERYAEEL